MHARLDDPWFHRSRRLGEARLRLFCLPYAGGGAAIYRSWSNDLPAEIEVWRVQLPGREDRLDDPPFTDAREAGSVLAEVIAPHLDLPYALFGHSMGAALAYETARALTGSGAAAPACLFASGRRAPHLPARKAPVHHLPDARFIEELRRLDGTPRDVLDNAELMEFMLPVVRGDFRLAESYQPSAVTPLPCPVVALGGLADADVPAADLEAWRIVGNGDFRLRMFAGGHFFINTDRRGVTRTVEAELVRLGRC